jgi:DNA-binding transcriptional regulator YiaG
MATSEVCSSIIPHSIRSIRGDRSQFDFCKSLNIEQVTLVRWENGIDVPSMDMCKQILSISSLVERGSGNWKIVPIGAVTQHHGPITEEDVTIALVVVATRGNISKARFASMLGVSQTNLSCWERAYGRPEAIDFVRLAAYAVDPERQYFIDLAGMSNIVPAKLSLTTREVKQAQRVVGKNAESVPDDIRDQGWTVAMHGDSQVKGKFRTCWLFTNEDGRYLKGEGQTDAEALNLVRQKLLKLKTDGNAK